jgi:glycosyltransferase involved in cell wall biosynthesis
MPDGEPRPKISIVTPSYNQGRFIEQTIRSVLLQGYPNLEYIVIDGGSTDNSVEIIKKYEEWLTYWVSEPDRGQSHAINKGFEKASGEIYAWLNSDDYLQKNALKNVATAYRVSPEAGGWFGGCSSVDKDDKPLYVRWPNRLDVESIAKWNEDRVGQPACFFSKKAWHECGPLDENLHYAMDFDLWIKIAKIFIIEQVNQLLAVEHAYEDTKTQRDRGQAYAAQWLIQIRHGYEHFAIQDISRQINRYEESSKLYERVVKIIQFPLLRPIKPIARIVWRKLL